MADNAKQVEGKKKLSKEERIAARSAPKVINF
jgi:hypothetical protein